MKECVAKMQGPAKGYGIYTMKTLKMGNLKEALAPLLADKAVSGIAFAALLSSPTPEDRKFAESLADGTGEVPAYILSGYLSSDDVEMTRKFLILIRDRPIPANYRFLFMMHPTLRSDTLYSQLKDTIRKTKNRHVVADLILSMKRCSDPDATAMFTQLAADLDPKIKNAAQIMLGSNR